MTKIATHPCHSVRNNARGISHLQVIILENMMHVSRGTHPKEGCQSRRKVIKHSNKSSKTMWPLMLIQSRPLQVLMTRLSIGNGRRPLLPDDTLMCLNYEHNM